MNRTPREKTISSDSNPVYRALLDLHASKGVRKHGRFLLFGEKVVRETLENPRPQIAPASLVALDGEPIGDFQRRLPPGAGTIRLAKPLFEALDLFGVRSPILVCAAPVLAEWTAKPVDGLEVLLALSDPSNLGACLRATAAFGVGKAVLLRECASPFHPRASRAASGALLATPLERGPSIHELDATAPPPETFVLDMTGEPLSEVRWPRRARLVLGEEGQGVPASVRGRRVTIPIDASAAESLNAASALSVALYAWRTGARG